MTSKANRTKRIYETNPRCYVCSLKIETLEECTLEHIIPKSLGGTSKLGNLAVSHLKCNQLKASSLIKGHDPESYVRLVKSQIDVMKEKLAKKHASLRKASGEMDFIRRRIKDLYGIYGYMTIMNHPDCPGGFDIKNFKKMYNLP